MEVLGSLPEVHHNLSVQRDSSSHKIFGYTQYILIKILEKNSEREKEKNRERKREKQRKKESEKVIGRQRYVVMRMVEAESKRRRVWKK